MQSNLNSKKQTAKDLPHSPHLVDLREVMLLKAANKKQQHRIHHKMRDGVFSLFEKRPKTPAKLQVATHQLQSENLEKKSEQTQRISIKHKHSWWWRLFFSILQLAIRSLSLASLPIIYTVVAVKMTGYGVYSFCLAIGKFFRRLPAIFTFRRKAKPVIEIEEAAIQTFSEFKSDFYTHSEQFDRKTELSFASRLRPLVGFAFILFVLILPFKGYSYFESIDDLRLKIMTSTQSAINELFRASQNAGSLKFKDAGSGFSEASRHFSDAQAELGQINSLLFSIASLMPNNELRLAGSSKAIVEAGQITADIGKTLTEAVDGLVNDRKSGLGQAISNFIAAGDKTIVMSDELDQKIASIDETSLPDSVRPKFIALKDRSALLRSGLRELVQIVRTMSVIFGVERDTRYLLVFQNNAEMRASGGFFGSYALVDFSKGNIKKIEVPAGGTYDVEKGYRIRVAAPTALSIVNPLWHFWDANWWYDWPTSANKLMWFYEKSGGPTVDGVISFTPTMIENFLRDFGPVDMTKDYGVVITADNFWEVAQTFSEQKKNVVDKPKKIIGDLFAQIIKEFPERLNKALLLKVFASTEQGLNQKQAMFYFTNPELQDFVAKMGWDGRVKNTTQDYLAVINSSVAGGKADKLITQTINHQATVLSDGSVIDEVEVVRTHHGIKGTTFTGVRNVNWLRVYVPAGSELIESSGFNIPDSKYFEKADPTWLQDPDLLPEEKNFILDQNSGTKIYQELGKTVFANWTMIDPGETRRAYFKYRLPFKAEKIVEPDFSPEIIHLLGLQGTKIVSYGLLAQKQPGSLNVELNSKLNLDPYQRENKTESIWNTPETEDFHRTSMGWNAQMNFKEDQYFALIIAQKK